VRHLGLRVSALVDDQLSHDERDRALAHVAHCEQCRVEVEQERGTKAALRQLPADEPPAELVRALLAMAETGGPLPPPRRPFPGPATPAVGWRRLDGRPGDRPVRGPATRRPDVAPRQQRARLQVAAAGTLSAGALLLVLATLGAPAATSSSPASVVPPMQTFRVEHAKSTGALPFVEPASILVPAGVLGDGR
jgi:anti-sigma factor RsiW